MKIEVDTHVHTVVSDHAYSTITEVVAEAAATGLKGIVVTEHGPAVPGAPPPFFFSVSPMPREKAGVRLYFGCEADILYSTGELDIYADQLRRLDFVIAALHQPVTKPSGRPHARDRQRDPPAGGLHSASGEPGFGIASRPRAAAPVISCWKSATTPSSCGPAGSRRIAACSAPARTSGRADRHGQRRASTAMSGAWAVPSVHRFSPRPDRKRTRRFRKLPSRTPRAGRGLCGAKRNLLRGLPF